MQEFYCTYIYNGVFQSTSQECFAAPLDSKGTRKLQKVNEAMQENLQGFFARQIEPALNQMRIVTGIVFNF